MSHTRMPMAGQPVRLKRHIQRITMAGLLLTALLVGLATLLPMDRQLRLETEQRSEFDTRLLAQIADHLLERLESNAAHISSRSELRNALARYNRGESDLAELQAFSIPRLQDALAHTPEVAALVRLDARGQAVVNLLGDIPAALWPLPPATATTPVLSAPLQLRGQHVLLIGMPILSREGQRLGTDIAAFSLGQLSQRLTAVPLHPATHSHLIHLASGRVMHVQRETAGLSEAPADCPLRALLADAGDRQSTLSAHRAGPGQRQLAFVPPLAEHPDWAVGLLAERDRLYAGARHNLLWPLLGILLLTIGGGAATLLAIRPLSRRLTAQAQSLELAASVFDCSNEGVVLMDTRQRVIAINPAGCRLTGHDASSIVGQPLDSLVAPEDPELHSASLWARAAYNGHWRGEVPIRRADGSTFHAWLSLAAVFDEERNPRHFAAVFADISAQKAEAERIHQMANYDRLTGLPNRALAQDRLQQALRKARRSGHPLAVLFLDLDRFKPVNDTFGHAVGDRLLQAVAQRLSDGLRSSDTVARLGGDEFLLILEDVAGAEAAGQLADNLLAALQEPFRIDGHDLQIGASIGIALYPDDGEDAAHLARSADTAMYQAKEAGRNRYAFHARQPQPAGVT